MAKFRFQLEGVLRLREHAEKQKMLAVARLEVERRAGERRITEYQEMIRSGKEDLRRALGPGRVAGVVGEARRGPSGHPGSVPGTVGPHESDSGGVVDPVAARLQAGAALHLQLKAQRAAVGLAGVLKKLGDARAELSKAAVERRGMERLKERRYEAWREEEARREAAVLDEIGTMGAARKLSGGGSTA